ncbi:MAG: OmpH family outer membrane protein, partial [Muribaculaceae bacterium]|nr:OmpH family outer membrane protein [Muribaculaceae bacterium]
MLKKLLLALVVALPCSAMAQKFGVVDSEAIITTMPEFNAMQTQIQETSKRYEDELQKLYDEANKLVADFQTIQNDANTPDPIKERKMQEIQERSQKIEQFRQTASQDIQRQQEQLIAPIQQKFTEAVQSVCAEGSFTFIFPSEPSLLLYSGSDVVDVT